MAYEIEGKILKIMDTKTFDSGFTVREFVVEKPDDKYPQPIALQVVQDRCAMLDDYREGDLVAASFDLRGREYNGRYFTNLQVWRMEKKQATAPVAQAAAADEPPLPDERMAPAEDDDFPF